MAQRFDEFSKFFGENFRFLFSVKFFWRGLHFFRFEQFVTSAEKNRNRVIVRLTPTDPNRPPAGDPTPVG